MSASLSRFQITEGNPQQPPHKCSVCGSISGTFIDFGLDLEFYGTVYFCVENCFTQLANELGYRSPAQHHLTLEALADRQNLVNTLQDTVERYANALDTLRRIDIGNFGSDGIAVRNDEEGERNNPIPAKAEPGSDEPAAKQGSSDFFNDDSLNDLLGNANS